MDLEKLSHQFNIEPDMDNDTEHRRGWFAVDPETDDWVGSLIVHAHRTRPNVWGFSGIEVEEPYRRQGAAMALWQRAESDLPEARFTHTSVTTDEGAALARSLRRRNPQKHGKPSRDLLSQRHYYVED